ncbi:hypothetical protein GALL_456560 [mine drainage metagenome]|uniref:Uncharacterized protein n=1 Tax=mine drainage metagenome TaxID=410659 RepID=A0A1J5PNI6_9ZZZZ
MSDHKDDKFSITVHSDDLAVGGLKSEVQHLAIR